MKVSVIEIDYHPEVLKNMCYILENTSLDVTFFTTEKIYHQVNNGAVFGNFKWVYFSKKESVKSFFHKHSDLLNASDVVFFNTLASQFKFFSKFQFNCKTVLRIHNTNAYFSRSIKYSPKWSLFYLFKDVSHFIRKTIFSLDWYYRKKVINKIDYFVFADEKLREYAIKNGLVDEKKTIESIPLAHYSKQYEKVQPTVEVVITIPGAIDPRRRDYNLFFDVLEDVASKITSPIKIYFLGRAKGKYADYVMNKFNSISNDKLSVVFYKERVPQSTFSSVLKATDFLVLPLKMSTRYTIYTERYGYTKISGGINDMIHYGKPSILPAAYPLSSDLESITAQYINEKEFSEIVLQWVNSKKFVDYQSSVAESLKKFDRNQLKQKMEHIFSAIN